MSLKLQIFAALVCLQGLLALSIISRSEWGASPAKWTTNLRSKPDYVVIHHSAGARVCATSEQCKSDLRNIQKDHLKKWSDIGYNFAVGGDGQVYEARGFGKQGSHAPSYNEKSIGIVLLGNFENTAVPAIMISAAKDLIKHAVDGGHLKSDYILYGHRQVKSTACPGKNLFNEIKNWPHWQNK